MSSNTDFEIDDIVRPNDLFIKIFGHQHEWIGHSYRITGFINKQKVATERLVYDGPSYGRTANFELIWIEKIA